MRVAVLADIHGNLPALEAVLADIDRLDSQHAHGRAVDAIVLNGDIADGPLPLATLDRLAALGDRAVWVSGNGERHLVEVAEGRFRPTGDPHDDILLWAGAQLRPDDRRRLAALPATVTLEIDGLGPVAFHHATARQDDEMLLVDSPIGHYRSALDAVPEQVVVLGHTHMPFDRLADRRRVINTGAVGMPYGHAGASWALLGPDVVLRRTEYDTRHAAEVLRSSDMPGLTEFIAECLVHQPSDAEALASFTPIADRQHAAR
jgi:predicted phosphodiesterase